MIKPNYKHTMAVKHSIMRFERAQSKAHDPKFIRSLQRDIKLLEDVHKILVHAIENPDLPFVNVTDGPVRPQFDPIEAATNAAF